MFGKLIRTHLRRRPSATGFEGAAWNDLPETYADGRREMQGDHRRHLRETFDFPSSAPFGTFR